MIAFKGFEVIPEVQPGLPCRRLLKEFYFSISGRRNLLISPLVDQTSIPHFVRNAANLYRSIQSFLKHNPARHSCKACPHESGGAGIREDPGFWVEPVRINRIGLMPSWMPMKLKQVTQLQKKLVLSRSVILWEKVTVELCLACG